MYNKVQILLHKKKSTASYLLEEKLLSEINNIAAKLPEGATCLSAIRLEDDPTQRIAHSEEISESAESFDAMFEVGTGNADLKQLAMPLRDVMQHLNEWIEPGRSAVIAGTAQGYYRDVKDFLEIMAQPEVTADAIEDEKNFIDHSRSVMGLFKIIGA